MTKQVFAFAGDYQYINPITVAIKSLFYHQPNSDVYLVNTDIPQEWFKIVNHQLAGSNNKIIDVKITPSIINQEHVGLDHISPIAYGKILLPDLLPQVDYLVYLDSDLIVDGSLDPLFDLDLADHPIACAPDVDAHDDSFNTGVIVYDLQKIRQIPHLVNEELKLGQDQGLRNADQDVMNHYFGQDFFKLPLEYNYQIGMDWIAFYSHHDYFYDLMDQVQEPKIIHYLTPDKPWKTTSSSRLRERWWQYAALSWQDVINQVPLPPLDPPYQKRFFTFLNSQNMGQLPALVAKLPNCQFNIAAWSNFGEPVIQLLSQPNVRLYPMINGPQLRQLGDTCNAYLDVNYDDKERKAIDPFEKKKKPIFTFEAVANNPHHYQNYHVFADDDINQMVNALKSC